MEHLNMLVSDVDNTLLGDDAALAQFAQWFDKTRGRLRLVYNSGRFYDSVCESIAESPLPVPDAIIGGVGTQIHLLSGSGSFLPNKAQSVGQRNGKKVPDPFGCERLPDWPPITDGWDAAAIRAAMLAHEELEPQPDHLQSPHKVSFFGYDLSEEFLSHLRDQLADLEYEAQIIYSSQRDLDVLPVAANKGTAIGRLVDHWGIDPNRVIVAGDSGNDLPMFEQGYRGITVGNAHDELRELSDPSIFHATGGYAAGLLEGLNYWLTDDRLAPAAS